MLKYFSINQQICPVAYGERFRDIVICNQYAYVFIFELSNDSLDIFNRNRVNPCKRFVKQNKLWVHGQSPGYFGPSSFAPAQYIPVAPANMVQVKFIDQ